MAGLSPSDRIRIILEMIGGPQFKAQAASAAASVRGIGGAAKGAASSQNLFGRATRSAGQQMSFFQKRTFLTNQALFTLRRYTFYATLAIGGLFAAGVKQGYEFNNTMQSARIILQKSGLSAKQTTDQLNKMFRISLYSPYLLKDIVTATQIMIRLGLTAPEATRTIQNLSNALAGLPDAGAKLNRAAFALGHMQTMGRLTGIVLTQLGRDNIPMAAALEKYFRLTGDQLRNVSKLGIPASAALQALNRYLETSPQYRNLAKQISLHTLGGLFAAFRDFFSQMSGTMLQPVYTAAQNLLFGLVRPGGLMDQVSKAAQRKGPGGGVTGALTVLSRYIGGGDVLAKSLVNIGHALTLVWRLFIGAFLPALIIGARILGTFAPILKIINFGLGILAHHTTILTVILVPLATLWLFIHIRMMATFLATKLLTLATFGLFKVEGKLLTIEKFKALWSSINSARMKTATTLTELYTIAQLKNLKALKAWAFAAKTQAVTGVFLEFKNTGPIAKFTRLLFKAAGAVKVFAAAQAAAALPGIMALLTNPIVPLIVAGIAFVGLLINLYFHWKAFHDAVNRTGRWFTDHWPAVKAALETIFAPLIVIADLSKLIYDYWSKIVSIANKVAAPFKALTNITGGYIPAPGGNIVKVPGTGEGGGSGFLHPSAKDAAHLIGKAAKAIWNIDILPFASGGVSPGGMALVGEGGPELAMFPRGTRIISNNDLTSMLSFSASHGGSSDGQPIVVQVMLDRKVLAEANAKAISDARANR